MLISMIYEYYDMGHERDRERVMAKQHICSISVAFLVLIVLLLLRIYLPSILPASCSSGST